jgi:AcrR family transcriptional regulator
VILIWVPIAEGNLVCSTLFYSNRTRFYNLSSSHGQDDATAPRTRHQRRTADVRSALVEAAERVLEGDGLAGLTVRAVAIEAGVAPMGVYNHLQDKAGLLLAVLGRAFDRLASATAWRSDVPPETALRMIGEAYRRLAHERPVTYGLMFGAPSSVQTLEQIGEHADAAYHQLVHAVRCAQQIGVLRCGDPDVLAGAIWSALHGAISLELSRSLPHTHAADAIYDTVLDMIGRGLG